MSQPISFVFVPGAWHTPEYWSKVTALLESTPRTGSEPNIACSSVTLPSTTGDPSLGVDADIKAAQTACQSQLALDRNVIVVVHSYGSLVGSSAIHTLPNTSSSSSSSSSTPRIIGLALIATGFPAPSTAFLAAFNGNPPPIWHLDRSTGFVEITVDKVDMLYHDLPPTEASLWVSKLTPHSIKSLEEGGEHVHAGWKDVPCWYLVCAEDHALPADTQRLACTMAQGEGADVTVREVQSSHSPMLSQPKATADFLLEAAAYFAEKN